MLNTISLNLKNIKANLLELIGKGIKTERSIDMIFSIFAQFASQFFVF